MLTKIKALWSLFRRGEAVADPALWKSRQVEASALVGVILAAVEVCRAFGLDLPVDEASAAAVAGGVLAVVNIVLTVVTTDKIGLPAKPGTNPQPRPADPEHPEPAAPSVDATGS